MAELDQFQHPRFARQWPKMSEMLDRRGYAQLRERLTDGLSGHVVELGCGDGRTFAHYPAEVTRVTAVEPDNQLRTHAERAAERAPVPVSVVAGHADALPGEDGTYDAAVVSLVLCSVPDVPAALAELYRVLRPGGELRFCEHVRSDKPLGGRIQDLITPLTVRFGGNDHQNRDTGTLIERSDLAVRRLERVPFKIHPLVPPQPLILGTAVRPGGTEQAD